MEWKVGLYSSMSVDRNKYFFYGLTLNLAMHSETYLDKWTRNINKKILMK